MILEVYVKKIGNKENLNTNHPLLSAFIDDNSAEEIIEKISRLRTIKKVEPIIGRLDPISYCVGFKVDGSDPSAVYQIITSNRYSIIKSKITAEYNVNQTRTSNIGKGLL